MMNPRTLPLSKERLEGKIHKDENGCWIWQGAKQVSGYGEMLSGGRKYLTHRVSYSLYKSDIPKGMVVCHTCDTPSCINPDHLFVGFPKDNTQDMKSKDRHLYGERNTEAKLTSEDVRQIIDLRNSGISQQKVADRYRVSRRNIRHIWQGARWKHLQEAA
jgi:hypothetical protein